MNIDINSMPDMAGVYFIYLPKIDKGYVGETNSLCSRIQQHLYHTNGKQFIKKYHEKYNDTEITILQVTKDLALNERKEIERQYKLHFEYEGVKLLNRLPSNKIENEWFHESKSVMQFDLKGILIKEWPSIFRAAKTLKFDTSSIVKACKGKISTCKGFIWIYSKDFKLELLLEKLDKSLIAINNRSIGGSKRKGITKECKIKSSYSKKSYYTKKPKLKVKQYDFNGNLVNVFASGYEAAKNLNIRTQAIYKCCRKEINTARSYIFLFEDDSIEKRLSELHTIFQYSAEGLHLNSYVNLVHASKETGIREDQLSKACLNDNICHAGGYLWFNNRNFSKNYLDEKIEIFRNYKDKFKIVAIKNGVIINTYENASVAARSLGIVPSAVNNCLNGFSKSSAGFVWKYAKESELINESLCVQNL